MNLGYPTGIVEPSGSEKTFVGEEQDTGGLQSPGSSP